MRILLCDDDELIIEQLKKYIISFFKNLKVPCPEMVSYNNGVALLADEGAKDILFLDIEMSGMNGIYVGNELKKRYPHLIIFIVTSYSEYLDEAMRFHVFRYLSKPIEQQRLFRNLKEALELYHTMSALVPIETREGVHTLPASAVIAVEAQGRKVMVHTTSGDYEAVHNMQYWRFMLSSNHFFQTHRSFLVNFEHVTDFDHMLVYLFHRQYRAYLTKRKYKEFKEAYLLYLESTR